LLNSAVQLGAELLPDANPQLSGSDRPVNANINKNLFFAANNVRVPAGSFTVYQAGLGRAATPQAPDQLDDLPAASFNSIWLGLSPVTKRRFSTNFRYQATGSVQAIASDGAEGGENSDIDFISVVNERIFSTRNLQNFYAQIYLSFFERDVDFLTTNELKETTSYYPHLGFTGDITRTKDVFRYYVGLIASARAKAYLGLDYTRTEPGGLRYSLAAIGYTNPDRDYYSQVQANLSQQIRLSKNSNLTLSTGLLWALDQDNQIDKTLVDSQASSVTLGARANLGSVSLGVTRVFGGILPNSLDDILLADVGIQLTPNFYLTGYWAIQDENPSRSRYGASTVLKLGQAYNSPTLALGWNNYEYDYGRDAFDHDLQVSQNTFSILFRVGAPPQPFNATTVERLQQQNNQQLEQQRIPARNSEPDAPPPPIVPPPAIAPPTAQP
jgi:hypothetical protein